MLLNKLTPALLFAAIIATGCGYQTDTPAGPNFKTPATQTCKFIEPPDEYRFADEPTEKEIAKKLGTSVEKARQTKADFADCPNPIIFGSILDRKGPVVDVVGDPEVWPRCWVTGIGIVDNTDFTANTPFSHISAICIRKNGTAV